MDLEIIGDQGRPTRDRPEVVEVTIIAERGGTFALAYHECPRPSGPQRQRTDFVTRPQPGSPARQMQQLSVRPRTFAGTVTRVTITAEDQRVFRVQYRHANGDQAVADGVATLHIRP